MRVFSAESVRMLSEDRETFVDLGSELARLGAIDDAGPKVFGVYLNLERDYRTLMDVGPNAGSDHRLFFRLLDSRVMISTIRATFALLGLAFPEEIDRFSLRAVDDDPAVVQASAQLGGTAGRTIYQQCRAVEAQMLEMLDSLLPVDWEQQGAGHSDLHSLRLLSSCEIHIDGRPLALRPLIMLDDGHRLHPIQRSALLERLVDRTLNIGRWYSERYQALSRQDLMEQLGSEGRDYELIELESVARGAAARDGRARFAPGQFERVLIDIAIRRAHRSLSRSLEEQDDFGELLQVDDDEFLGARESEVLATLRARVELLAGGDPRYEAWVVDARMLAGYAAALRWRELEVLIRRDQGRAQGSLFS
ncbi:MAG: hypothetical protein JNK04_20915, partial [Myxococcales bacterium]|nr:hypothetical protein [Myxococcales bacterium]